MIYNLAMPLDRERFSTRANILLQKQAVIDCTEKTLRSGNQNSYIHLLIGVVAMETGVTIDYAKREYFKKLVNRDIFVRKVTDKFCGEGEDIRSSASLSVEEMTMAIDRFKRWGAENGFYFPDPLDEARLKDIEIEIGRMRHYL